ncbi:MAG: rubrerythrin family protein [Candidatus Lokiarchaeota archaeon]|nr:rubrerythrin family protein [Candidatus Lokiarchaeota archaeon]
MTKSEKNLKTAFAGESQANRKYLAFAKKAEQDGFLQIAKIFKAAAAAETIHAHNHLKVLGGIKSTIENIKEAIEGEHYEFTEMYPQFMKEAKEEKDEKALRTFDYANQVEKVHHELYSKALKAAESGVKLKEEDIYVCPICGYTIAGEVPDKCPVCGAVKKVFNKIE